ncbi:MAG: hypothetical protein A4E48_00277 [Methanosaeta sp. PtaU1.Bin060]|nr:MAG: hypothetical protein A4E48_00277 [Methanosaeta sp. PtaU1.Bin060]
MIDHKVTVGGIDVSFDLISFEVQQQVAEADSDPGKIKIVLANPHQKYTNRFFPQTTEIEIIVYNWAYDTEEKRRLAGGHAQTEYLVATGHMTALSSNHEEAEILGECDLGHLADALPKDHDYDALPTTAKEALETILSWHTDEPIRLDWDETLKDKTIERVTYDADMTYQSVVDDIAMIVGAVYYFSEDNVLKFKNPASTEGEYDLDSYISNPDQTASITGFRNSVVVIGNSSDEHIDPDGIVIPAPDPIIAMATDDESIAEVGVLMAPAEYAYNIKTQEEADARADQLLKLYKMHENAETKPIVEGIVPPLMSKVSYTPFVPISASEIAKMNAALSSRLSELQAIEDALAEEHGRAANKVSISSRVYGVVVGKKVTYSIDGLKCELTISPGLLEVNDPITDESISGSVYNLSEEYEE